MNEGERVKIKYEPSTRRRYDISPDEISRERVKWYMRAFKDFRAQFPVPVTITFFGSLTKGKVLDETIAHHSDVDAHIFIDAEAFATKTEEVINFMQERGIKVPDAFKEHPKFLFRRQDSFKNLFLQFLNQARQNDMRISDKKIVEGLGFDPIAHSGPYSILSKVISYEEQERETHPDTEDYFWFDQSGHLPVGMVFSLNAGGGMKCYIQSFLKQLSELPQETAERHWKAVLRATQKTDRPNGVTSELQPFYPQNFKEAEEYYKVGGSTQTVITDSAQ